MRAKETWELIADEAITRFLHRTETDELDPVEELTDSAAHASDRGACIDAHAPTEFCFAESYFAQNESE